MKRALTRSSRGNEALISFPVEGAESLVTSAATSAE